MKLWSVERKKCCNWWAAVKSLLNRDMMSCCRLSWQLRRQSMNCTRTLSCWRTFAIASYRCAFYQLICLWWRTFMTSSWYCNIVQLCNTHPFCSCCWCLCSFVCQFSFTCKHSKLSSCALSVFFYITVGICSFCSLWLLISIYWHYQCFKCGFITTTITATI